VVTRSKLIEKLKLNLENHKRDYEEAMDGYKSALLNKIDSAFEDAKIKLEKNYKKLRGEVNDLSDDDISKRSDHLTLVDQIFLEMKVPKSYADEYETVIAMFEWDTSDEVELHYAEFTCYVLDKWDWKGRFEGISMLYKSF